VHPLFQLRTFSQAPLYMFMCVYSVRPKPHSWFILINWYFKKRTNWTQYILDTIYRFTIVYRYLFFVKKNEKSEFSIVKPIECPKKHGNSVTNWISSLLWISIVTPNFKSHNIIMSARVYFMKRVKDCKDVFIMSPQDEQWRRTSLLCLYPAIFLFY